MTRGHLTFSSTWWEAHGPPALIGSPMTRGHLTISRTLWGARGRPLP